MSDVHKKSDCKALDAAATSSGMTHHLTPLSVCECLFGTLEDLALVCGYDRKSAYPWRHASTTRDAGDFPSARLMRRLLDHSERCGLGLTAEHLVRGADRGEIEAILARRATECAARSDVAAE